MLSLLPYNVKSRQSIELENNLLADNHPILFEVLHTCYLLNDPRFKNRKKIYRHSNIEHDYYSELSRSERNFIKKIYLKIEAWKLKRFERILHHANVILAVNQKDTDYFRRKFTKVRSEYLPSFHPDSKLNIQMGKGDYILFHGNLSVSENYEAAEWLSKNVFSKLNYRCVIAGLNPPEFLKTLVKDYSNVELVIAPEEPEMKQLIRNAQVHALYTAQPTGLKLKLLNVLFNGRFVICNQNMLAGTGLKKNHSLRVAEHLEGFISTIEEAFNSGFTDDLTAERKLLITAFDNEGNGKKLSDLVFKNFQTF